MYINKKGIVLDMYYIWNLEVLFYLKECKYMKIC